jgi:hypothetical protein
MSNWLVSKKTYALFLYSSWVVVFLGVFMVFMLTPWFQQIDTRHTGDLLLRFFGGILGVLGAPAALIILFGMAIFCVREDRAPTQTKFFWFIVFFTTACFGATAYFFRVYKRQVGRLAGSIKGDVK